MYHRYAMGHEKYKDGEYIGGSKSLENMPDPQPPGTARKELPDGDEAGIWDAKTLTFIPRPVEDDVLSVREFLGRITDDELMDIQDLAETDRRARLIWSKLAMQWDVIMNNYTLDGLEYLQTKGALGPGRAEAIFNKPAVEIL